MRKTLELEALLERVGGDQELLKELALVFLDDYPRLLDEIRQAINHNDCARLERSAHTLKGSVGNFTTADAFQAALRMEELGKSEHLDAAVGALVTLEQSLDELQVALGDLSSQ